MANSVYKSIPAYLPADGQTVWMRTILNEFNPFKAIFDSDSMTAISLDNSVEYPIHLCHSWKPVA